jgi:putative tryptophan/tyrosine transport system substrate-binding protein
VGVSKRGRKTTIAISYDALRMSGLGQNSAVPRRPRRGGRVERRCHSRRGNRSGGRGKACDIGDPIVFPSAGDPIGSGLVASLARPGGNVTGLSNLGSDLAAKRLGLLREVLPGFRRLAVMANAAYSGGVTEMLEIDAAVHTLGLEIVAFPIRRVEEIAPSFDALKGRAEALYVVGDPLANTHRLRINTFALAARLPTMHSQREYVEAGGLMSYGANFPDLNRRAADYVDKILRGAKPADIPVEQPTKFDLVVNLITAQALGLEVPPSLLGRADEVIE